MTQTHRQQSRAIFLRYILFQDISYIALAFVISFKKSHVATGCAIYCRYRYSFCYALLLYNVNILTKLNDAVRVNSIS